jgi:hypothetical protein
MVAGVPSPYPASFDGSTIRYQLALFALMCISIVGGMVTSWMAKEIVHGRREAFPYEPLFAMRVIFFCCGLSAFLRSAPEAAMMITWHENITLASNILVLKRWCDALAVIPAMTWMSLVFIFYPSVCMSMVRIARESGGGALPPLLPRARVAKLVKVIALVFVISTLIALGKRW